MQQGSRDAGASIDHVRAVALHSVDVEQEDHPLHWV
jgi:hypothetical protein